MVCPTFLEVNFFLDIMIFSSETKHNHPSFPRMTATTELSEDGELKLSVVHFCIRKAGKENNATERSRWPVSYHCRSDDLCGLNLFVYSHICKKETFLMLAAAILYIMHVLYTQYIPLPTHNIKG